MIYLVRDPRGTLESRWRMPWCRSGDCRRAELLCGDLADDRRTENFFRHFRPGRIK